MSITIKPISRNKMITKILIVTAVVIVLAVVFVAMQPNDFRMTRSTLITAPPSEVFANVNDQHRFQVWSPFNKMDPQIKETFEGPSAGTGAIYRWTGDKNVGEGTSTIVESRTNEMVRFRLEFRKPFVGTNDVIFTVQPEGEQTKVTWDMTGKKNFVMKGLSFLMCMEKMCGDQFEKGLSSLKTLSESGTLAKSN